MQEIAASLERVQERIARAAERAGRRRDDVLLIAVSKTVEAARIRDALAAGVRALGENRVQEARGKIAEIGRPVPWHLIGPLQTNKVKDAVELFDVIQSVDRLALAQECDRRARGRGRTLDVLVEINVAGEPTKSGFAPAALPAALETLATLSALRVRGLMAIPPAVEQPDAARTWFRTLASLARRHGLSDLSMGMSGDFEVAVEEGATMVRVGTAIFGARPARAAAPERRVERESA
jgi:pyridoxal phosphate enzyme (YggS family)